MQTLVVARDVSGVRRSSDLREAFASVVSHELRTPVTTIYGGAQLLVDPAMSEATRSEAAAAVAEEAEHLYRVVEDLVVLARYDQPLTTTDDPVLLQRFVPEVVASEASRGGIRVTVDVPAGLPAVVARGGYVEQVVRHLVTSAVRFSPRDGAVSVTARVAGEAVEVLVRDSGSSITEAEAAQVFDLFHRSARTVTDASGANMSLFVCKRLVEAMGGRIWARPREDDAGVELDSRCRSPAATNKRAVGARSGVRLPQRGRDARGRLDDPLGDDRLAARRREPVGRSVDMHRRHDVAVLVCDRRGHGGDALGVFVATSTRRPPPAPCGLARGWRPGRRWSAR